jgi:hypothetical protein
MQAPQPTASPLPPEASPGGNPRKNLAVILTLAGVFLAMGVTLLVFLLIQRQRVQSGRYEGLESLLQAPDGTALRSGVGTELRPRPAGRPEGVQSEIVPEATNGSPAADAQATQDER